MYGSEITDFLVKYYDLAFGISGEAEVVWYLNLVRRSGDPVLDLACGTGRLAILLAKQGFNITGIDASEGMLNQFQSRLKEETQEVQARIQIHHQRMSAFEMQAGFNTVICCDAFFHNTTAEDQINCLDKIHQHLNPNGRLGFNLPNPNPDFILKCEHSDGKTFVERGRYPLPNDTGTLVVEQMNQGRAQDQTITTTLRLTRYDSKGKIEEQGHSEWTTRYLYRWEAEHLLHRCGFEVISLVGNYKGGPVGYGSQLIFEARRL